MTISSSLKCPSQSSSVAGRATKLFLRRLKHLLYHAQISAVGGWIGFRLTVQDGRTMYETYINGAFAHEPPRIQAPEKKSLRSQYCGEASLTTELTQRVPETARCASRKASQ
jgi:hypothetical protein